MVEYLRYGIVTKLKWHNTGAHNTIQRILTCHIYVVVNSKDSSYRSCSCLHYEDKYLKLYASE